MEIHINMMAVLIAVAANFVLGFLWYTPLFGKAWAKEKGFDTSVKPPSGAIAKGMVIMVIGNFFMAYVLAHDIMAWSYVPGAAEMSTMSKVLSSAFFTWLGFFLPVDLAGVAWEKHSFKLLAINTVYHFLSLLVVAAILTYM